MGFDKLAEAVGEITEEFRPGNPRKYTDAEIKDKLARINDMYQRTIDGIHAYEQSL